MLRRRQVVTIALLGCLVMGLGWIDRSWQEGSSANPNQRVSYKTADKPTKIGADERIADYTWWLAVLTGALVIVSISQGFFLLRADKTARMTAAAALKSAETAEKDLLASHQPLVTISNLELCEPNSRDEERTHISFRLRNSGKGLAIVHQIGVTIQTVDRNQQQRARFTSAKWTGAIESGESSDENRLTSEILGANEWNLIRGGQMALFVTFEIIGQDIFKNRTRQIFPFVYNTRGWRFERSPSQWTQEQESRSE
jgi:hypothetical protein